MTDPVFKPLQRVQSRIFAIQQENVDTDQILPARFMANAQRVDLAGALFCDWRGDVTNDDAVRLNAVEAGNREILVAGRDFGTGSSREHAVWALVDFGFRVIISSKIADIFAGNAVRNGLLAIEVPAAVNNALIGARGAEILVDLLDCKLTVPALGLRHAFEVDPFARLCLLEGRDALAYLVDQKPDIAKYMARACIPSPDLRAAVRRLS